MRRISIAMTDATAVSLAAHLLRRDGQEDLCIATYRVSTGAERTTYLINGVLLPVPGEREVHHNVSFTGDYVLRAAARAASAGEGIAILHSHPRGHGWQQMSPYDADAERSYAHLVHALTDLPLFGMTLAGDSTWSARAWDSSGEPTAAESVRVVGGRLKIAWNDDQRPVPGRQPSQVRTISAWGESQQADLARLQVLVVGVGSVGLDVAVRLAATGIERLGVMDYDIVETLNRDRLIGSRAADADGGRKKVDLAHELSLQAATAANPAIRSYDLSICSPEGHAHALDYDVIFSCVDRPWPRAVLNSLAYTDLVPVIDGGIAIDAFDDGTGMRNATWRTHVLRPGRPCMACNEQLDLATATVDRQGLLDDPVYIANAGQTLDRGRQNVALLSASVSAGLFAQFVSLAVAPGGLGEPGPLRYTLSTHDVEHLAVKSRPNCLIENAAAVGDKRFDLTGRHPAHANAC